MVIHPLTQSGTLCLSWQKSSLTRARTFWNPAEAESVTGPVSARASGDVFEVGHIPTPDRALLARVVDSWPRLPDPLKLAILAITDAAPR